MYISFCDHVYFTKGFKKSCIYDFGKGLLYHLTEDETYFVERLIGKNADNLNLSAKESEQLTFLINKEILCYHNKVNIGKINKIDSGKVNFAWIEVTSRCNLRCLHCYDESDNFSGKTMCVEDFIYVGDQLASIGVSGIQIIGGEPLILGQDLIPMIQYASSHFENVEVFTNGTLLTDWWANFFQEHKIKVALSVYSYDENMHDTVTKKSGSYQKTTQAIRRLSDRNIKYRIANVLMKNIDLGAKNTEFYKLNPDKDIVRMAGRGNLSLLSRELLKKKLITEKTFSTPLSMALLHRIRHGHNCFSRRLYVAADLTIYPCVMERRVSHGSLKTGNLKDILKHDIFSLDKDRINGCKDCEFRYCCHDCRPDSLSENILEKPWNCTYDPYKGIWIDSDSFIDKLETEYDIVF